MHVGKWPAAKRSACVAPEVDLRECTLHSPPPKNEIRQDPLWLWNPEEMSPEIQNRGTSGPQKRHVSAKKFFKKMKEELTSNPHLKDQMKWNWNYFNIEQDKMVFHLEQQNKTFTF